MPSVCLANCVLPQLALGACVSGMVVILYVWLSVNSLLATYLSGFLLATKIWGGSTINEWAYICSMPNSLECIF